MSSSMKVTFDTEAYSNFLVDNVKMTTHVDETQQVHVKTDFFGSILFFTFSYGEEMRMTVHDRRGEFLNMVLADHTLDEEEIRMYTQVVSLAVGIQGGAHVGKIDVSQFLSM